MNQFEMFSAGKLFSVLKTFDSRGLLFQTILPHLYLAVCFPFNKVASPKALFVFLRILASNNPESKIDLRSQNCKRDLRCPVSRDGH